MKPNYIFHSFDSGMNVPVIDVESFLIETYIRMSGNSVKVKKVTGIEATAKSRFSFDCEYKYPPSLERKIGGKGNEKHEGFENVLNEIKSNIDLTMELDLTPVLQQEVDKRVKFLFKELFPVVVYYIFISNFENLKTELGKQIKISGLKFSNYYRRKRIAENVKDYYLSKYFEYIPTEYHIYRKLENVIQTISKWVEEKKGDFLVTKKGPMLIDALLYTLLSYIFFPPFENFQELKYLLKKKEDLQMYLRTLSKKYYAKFNQPRPSFHDVTVRIDLERNDIIQVRREMGEVKNSAYYWIGGCVATFIAFAIVKKHIPMTVSSPLFWFLRKLDSLWKSKVEEEVEGDDDS